MTDYPIERHPLEPFLPEGGRILMLGSFPPAQKRWSMDFFYPNWINDMWRIMGHIFMSDKDAFVCRDSEGNMLKRFDRKRIEKFCREQGIALFDTATEVRRLKDNASDKFLEIVEPTLLDGTCGKTEWHDSADKVLADVPCSGLGVIRRKPEIKYKEITDFAELVSIQKKILNNAAKYVKKGGTLVYSTCTINKDENELQVRAFLEENSEFELIRDKQFLPTENIDGFYVCKMIRNK